MIKKLLTIFAALALASPSLQSLAARGGEKGPSDRARERASDNASFKRDGGHEDPYAVHDSDSGKNDKDKKHKDREDSDSDGHGHDSDSDDHDGDRNYKRDRDDNRDGKRDHHRDYDDDGEY